MSKFFYSPVVGIDVSADFSYVAILKPNGDVYKKSFKIKHDISGFNYLLNEIKKVEKEFNMKTGIFMESTGVYHLSLFHFLNKNFYNTFVINPLVTKCNKNVDIRKVKNDKKDALSIATIGKFQNIKLSKPNNLDIFLLKNLVREYYKLTDTCSTYKKKLSADLRVIFPNYNTIFSDPTSNTSLAILSNYPTPEAIIDAPKEDVIKILNNKSRKGLSWSEDKYSKLITIAKDAYIIGVPLSGLAEFSESIKKNIELIDSIPGIGRLTAITLIAEIGDINGVLLEYYKVNLQGKKAKVALVAIMHKLINYIFAVLRNQTPFELRNPKIHKQMFLENTSQNSAT